MYHFVACFNANMDVFMYDSGLLLSTEVLGKYVKYVVEV